MGVIIPDRTQGNKYSERVTVYKTEEPSLHKATHDFTNKCTWYQESSEVTGETLTLKGGETKVYESANTHWIDVVSGATARQDLLQDYKPVIYDNAVEVSDDDYAINYTTGEVTFDAVRTGPITADYFYANGSTWSIAPEENKILLIEHSEIQFSVDVEINTPLRFEIWVGSPGSKILYQYVQYNSMRDFINEANLGTGVIPQMADLPTDIAVFPFNYGSIKPLAYSTGAELRVMSVDDIELTGGYGTGTFYCLSRDE